jgi:hypothetical protein
MQKQLKEAEKVLSEKRAKSRTPTKVGKIKGDVKKAKNRWVQN